MTVASLTAMGMEKATTTPRKLRLQREESDEVRVKSIGQPLSRRHGALK